MAQYSSWGINPNLKSVVCVCMRGKGFCLFCWFFLLLLGFGELECSGFFVVWFWVLFVCLLLSMFHGSTKSLDLLHQVIHYDFQLFSKDFPSR